MKATAQTSVPTTEDPVLRDDGMNDTSNDDSNNSGQSAKADSDDDEATRSDDEKTSDYIPTWTKTYNSTNPFSDSSQGIVNLGTDDCIITIDVRSVVYKTEPLEEIMNSEFKSY